MAHIGVLLREEALALASRKMAGQRLKDAKQFLLWHRRSPESIEKFMARIVGLPDLDIDPADRQHVSGVSAGERARMQDERDAGDTLRVIAARHHLSPGAVCAMTTAAVKA